MNINNVNSPNLMSALERRPGEMRKEKKAVNEQEAAFGNELLQAAIPLRSEPQALPSLQLEAPGAPVEQSERKGVDIEKSKEGPENVSGIVTFGKAALPMQAKAVNSQTYSGNVERSTGTLKAAASLNTAAAIAGLKPWSKEWVFEDRMEGAAIQPLLSSSKENPQQMLAQLEQMIASAKKASGAEASGKAEKLQSAGGPETGATQAASVSQLMRGGAENATEISEFTIGMQPNSQGPVQLKGNQVSGGASALSGAEFLSTLNAVREESGKTADYGSSSGNQGEQREQGDRKQQGSPVQSTKLRVIEGGGGLEKVKKAEFRNSLAAQAGLDVGAQQALHNSQLSRPMGMPRPKEITGHVTQGRMTENRLSSEALLGLSSGIRELKAQGGGEIRIRLKPENLGELHLKVVTSGNSVGLQIQASDERSRKIIEETMSHLKDSLASQNLSLGKVDLTVAASSQLAGQFSGSDLDRGQEQQAKGQQNFDSSNLLGQNMNQQGQLGNQSGGSGRWDNIDSDMTSVSNTGRSRGVSRRAAGPVGQAAGSNSGYASTAGSGRLDVMA